MNAPTQKLTRDQPVPNQIKVPGELDEHWLESDGGIVLSIEQTGEELHLLPLSLVLTVLMPWNGPIKEIWALVGQPAGNCYQRKTGNIVY